MPFTASSLSFHFFLFGVEFPQQGGMFQGGPLSPLLYVLFLIDLILYFNGAEGSAFHGVPVPCYSGCHQVTFVRRRRGGSGFIYPSVTGSSQPNLELGSPATHETFHP